jgi:hypothetical protein
MKKSKMSFDETIIINSSIEHDCKNRKISKNNSNSFYLKIISIILLTILMINLYQVIIRKSKQNFFK